jgi:hypothetical protein
MKRTDAKVRSARRRAQRDWKALERRVQYSRRQRWKYLCGDRDFVLETARLKYNLTVQYRESHSVLGEFFDPSYWITAGDVKTELKRISEISNSHLRHVMERYLRYAIRFRVYMRLQPKRGDRERICPFCVHLIDSDGVKFHALIEDGKLMPVGSYSEDDTASDAFASDSLEVPPALEELISPKKPPVNRRMPDVAMTSLINASSGAPNPTIARSQSFLPRAKFVLVEHDDKESLLHDLLDLSYTPEALTFVQVAGATPYMLCIIGENVAIDTVWRQAGAAVKQLQVQLYERQRAGRPLKRSALKKGMIQLLQGSRFTPLKTKVEHKSLKSLSAIRRTLEL